MMENNLRIGIIGLGLIGGSLAKAFKEKGHTIFCLDSNHETIKSAKDSSMFENCFETLDDLLEESLDLLYIATPVSSTKEILLHLAEVECKIPITDASSTKLSIEKLASDFDLVFCGGHPIAGREKSGFEHSDPAIFQGAAHILTNEDAPHFELLKELHTSIGMKVYFMKPEFHDFIFALISHFPHLAAFSLVELVQHIEPEAFNFTGGGFKDFTRIAGSDPTMWSSIFADNHENIVHLIDKYIEILSEWKRLIESNDRINIYNKIKDASNIRRGL